MASSGESRSVFVVQRAFRRVRRGYDPEEVDRHLQLVSEWFAGSRVGDTAREIEARLQEREQALAEQAAEARHLVEGARIEAEATLEGARKRADADAREAEEIVARAREQADELRRGADDIAAAARERADEVLRRAEQERAAMLERARLEA